MTSRAEGNNPEWYFNNRLGRRKLFASAGAIGTGVILGSACESSKDVYSDVNLAGYFPGFVAIRSGAIQEGRLNARSTPRILKDNSNLYEKIVGNRGLWGIQGVSVMKEGDQGPIAALSSSEFVAIKNPGIVVGPDSDYWIPLQLEIYTHTQYRNPDGGTSNRYTRSQSRWYVSFGAETERYVVPVDNHGEPIVSDLNPNNGIIPVTRKSDGSYVTSSDRKPITDLGKGVILNNTGNTFPSN